MASRLLKATVTPRSELIKMSMVDDDKHERHLMKRAVDQSRLFDCVGIYTGGMQALEHIQSSASEVVLMDVRMPGMSGPECTRELKRTRPDLPIIMMSGYDDPRILAESLEAGADGFWAKRHPESGFLESLAVWLRRRKFGISGARSPENFLFGQTKQSARPGSFPLPRFSEQSDESPTHGQRKSVERGHGLSVEQSHVRNALERIVLGLERDFHARQDLLQEASVDFWTRNRQYPGQRLSWYLQGVRFHLKDLKNSGCSVDSQKRRGGQARFPDQSDEWDHWRDSLEFDEGFLSAAMCRDGFSVLVDKLKGVDKRILGELAEGLGICEIAERLSVSHQSVIRSRERIAALAIKLGIVPPPE